MKSLSITSTLACCILSIGLSIESCKTTDPIKSIDLTGQWQIKSIKITPELVYNSTKYSDLIPVQKQLTNSSSCVDDTRLVFKGDGTLIRQSPSGLCDKLMNDFLHYQTATYKTTGSSLRIDIIKGTYWIDFYELSLDGNVLTMKQNGEADNIARINTWTLVKQ